MSGKKYYCRISTIGMWGMLSQGSYHNKNRLCVKSGPKYNWTAIKWHHKHIFRCSCIRSQTKRSIHTTGSIHTTVSGTSDACLLPVNLPSSSPSNTITLCVVWGCDFVSCDVVSSEAVALLALFEDLRNDAMDDCLLDWWSDTGWSLVICIPTWNRRAPSWGLPNYILATQYWLGLTCTVS